MRAGQCFARNAHASSPLPRLCGRGIEGEGTAPRPPHPNPLPRKAGGEGEEIDFCCLMPSLRCTSPPRSLRSCSSRPPRPKPFEFKDGDRVVWLGSTLVEREQRYGYWETALIAANADKNDHRSATSAGAATPSTARPAAASTSTTPRSVLQATRRSDARTEADGDLRQLRHERIVRGEGRACRSSRRGWRSCSMRSKPANARIVLFTPMPFEQVAEHSRSGPR